MFMSSKELLCTIASQTFAEFSFGPNQFHAEALPPEGTESGESGLNLTSAPASLDALTQHISKFTRSIASHGLPGATPCWDFSWKETRALA
jgi:hypothetical protein